MCVALYRAKYAVGAIKRKLNDKNPHVALYGLEVGPADLLTLPCLLMEAYYTEINRRRR